VITTAGRVLTLGFFIGAAWSLGGSGCVRKVDDHCANLSGDASCVGYFDNTDTPRFFCSKCVSAYHGCLPEPPDDEGCWQKGSDPSQPPMDDTGTTGPEPVTMTESSGTTGDGMTAGTGDGSGSDGSSSGMPQPVCGDQTIEGDEVCDTDNLDGQDCSAFDGSGGLACNDDCTLNPRSCDGFSECGDNMIQGSEECDGTDLDGESCATLEDERTGGQLTCANCLFNTTACCLPNDATCEVAEDCCSGICMGALATPLLKTCRAPA
jgi:hypothetical protein